MHNESPVLVVGGTGALGRQVVAALLQRDKRVRMLVRPTSSRADFDPDRIEFAQGDMMDPASLLRAMDGADAVITSAAGYTRHTRSDTAETDTVGNRNLVDAAAKAGVRRFVLTSILTCDQTPQVPHFWHKKLVEDRLAEQRVPYVALRPGAFLETVAQSGDPFAKGRLIYAGSRDVPMTFVHTPDLANYLAQAVDAAGVDNSHIDIGWDRPVSVADIAHIAGELLGKRLRTTVIPGGPLAAVSTVFGWANPSLKDMAKMVRWFQTGNYVADTRRQHEVFGAPPTAEQAIEAYLRRLGHLS
jgi:uncharacterized protein YbjT (DUF2867 family)